MIKLSEGPTGPARHRARGREEAHQFYSAVLAMAGHDLRQPLQVIQSSLDLLALGDGKRKRAQLERGQHAVARMTEQLNCLVGALRIYEHTSNLQLSDVRLEPLFDMLRIENREIAFRNGVEVRICPTNAVVLSNAVMLDGIVRNLVRNAIKYTPPGGRILIGCRRRGPETRIDVCDTGIGIAPDKVPRVFEAFSRLDTTRADGLGLGLFVVRRAVALLGHRVEVKSMLGNGSRFSVLAPTAAATAHPSSMWKVAAEVPWHDDPAAFTQNHAPRMRSEASTSDWL